MTEPRYSDGTLAKWYYSQTNVISDGDNEYYLRNKESFKDLNYNELLGTNDLLDELNRLSDENEQLKKDATILVYSNQEYRGENEQLKKELGEFKKWEKYIGDVKREELDRVFKMSIYEIAEAFEYYEERIEKLERSCNE